MAEDRFGDLVRRYAAALNEADELAAALGALDPLCAEGMEAPPTAAARSSGAPAAWPSTATAVALKERVALLRRNGHS